MAKSKRVTSPSKIIASRWADDELELTPFEEEIARQEESVREEFFLLAGIRFNEEPED